MKYGRHWLLLGAFALQCGTTACGTVTYAPNDPLSPLKLQQAIELPDTNGRIDHLAVDVGGSRLFVAEVANGSLDIIDLSSGRVVRHVSGLSEPQGVGWLPVQREIVVACGDGSVRFYDAAGKRQVAKLDLGSDADNVRVDPRNGHIVVGYGSGGLAVIDPATHSELRKVTFRGHPEGFRLVEGLALVNVPDDGAVLSVNIDDGRVIARWPTGLRRLNFPMVVNPDGRSITIAYRLPATLQRIDIETGRALASYSACGDADDLFMVGERTLIVCGAGSVGVVENDKLSALVKTRGGARTGLYIPELKTLFVALPPARGSPAAIWAFRVRP